MQETTTHIKASLFLSITHLQYLFFPMSMKRKLPCGHVLFQGSYSEIQTPRWSSDDAQLILTRLTDTKLDIYFVRGRNDSRSIKVQSFRRCDRNPSSARALRLLLNPSLTKPGAHFCVSRVLAYANLFKANFSVDPHALKKPQSKRVMFRGGFRWKG